MGLGRALSTFSRDPLDSLAQTGNFWTLQGERKRLSVRMRFEVVFGLSPGSRVTLA